MPTPANKERADQGRKGYALLLSPAVQHLRTALDQSPSVSLSTLGRTIPNDAFNTPDFHRVKLHEKIEKTDAGAKTFMLGRAAQKLAAWLDIKGDTVSLRPGVSPDDLRFEGEPIRPFSGLAHNHYLKSPFDPLKLTGTFAENIRKRGDGSAKDDLSELRDSMKHFGWLDHHPAILDENGVIIAGHRRLAAAKQLGIEPRTVTITFGTGDPGDAERMRYALASNLGGRPLNAADRKHVAQRLYKTGEWSQEAIAIALKTARQNIARDVAGIVPLLPTGGQYANRSRRVGGGRKPAPKQDKALETARRMTATGERVTRTSLVKAGVEEHSAKTVVSILTHEKQLFGGDDPLRTAAAQCFTEALQRSPVPLTSEGLLAIVRELEQLAKGDDDAIQPQEAVYA